MSCHNPGCLGNYDFDKIAFYARQRFVEGIQTISLLEQARSQREKEEIALVCMLDIADDQVRDLQLSCRYSGQCEVTTCRSRLRKMITAELAVH
jgi:ferredoxin